MNSTRLKEKFIILHIIPIIQDHLLEKLFFYQLYYPEISVPNRLHISSLFLYFSFYNTDLYVSPYASISSHIYL